MPSRRCATSAKRNENYLSAAVTNRMACQSRCEIQVQASHRRILIACSKPSTARNRAVWGLGCRSAGRLSKRITDGCGRALTCHVALSLASLRLLIQPPHREWCLGAAAACLVLLKAKTLAAALIQPPFDRVQPPSSHDRPRDVSPHQPWSLLAVDCGDLAPGLKSGAGPRGKQKPHRSAAWFVYS